MSQLKPKIAVGVSGNGRTLHNLLKGDFPFEVGAVICSNPKAGAIAIAKQFGVDCLTLDFKNIDALRLDAWLLEHAIRWIALAGFLKPFPSLPSFADRVINIHPSLLPAFGGHGMYGMRVHEAVFKAGEKITGATVHLVNERYDEGSVLAQGSIEVGHLASPQDLAAAVFALECELYPAVISGLVSGKLPLSEGRIWHFEKDLQC